MTSLLFITEVLSLQSEAVSFTKGFMWAGVIKALLDLHCLFRVIWREYNRCFSRRQSATTFRNWTWKSRSKWIQQVPCRIPLGWDCSWSQRRSSFLELWLHSCSMKDCRKNAWHWMLIYIMTSVGKFDDRTPYEQHLSLGSTLFEAVQNVLREYYGRKTLSQFANFSFARYHELAVPSCL